MEQYLIYLRKSRLDAEAEARGEGETLARHEKALFELARRLKLNVTDVYKEVVSGETVAARPIMQKLLQEVEQGVWAGVLVMEVERLARGDTMDQGFVAQAFKYTNTKIVTPLKTYDPNDEFDEEYFEFGLFMSRREYKVITRRLQRGRIASVKEGKYLGSVPPYGYNRKKLATGKGWTLEPNPEQADVVRMIFELYINGESQDDGSLKRIGTSLIARRLNSLNIPTQRGNLWESCNVIGILDNPVYAGKLRWNYRPITKRITNGNIASFRPRSSVEQLLIAEGLHEPIITSDVFNRAQELRLSTPAIPNSSNRALTNPLSGLVICGLCGRSMVRIPRQGKRADTLNCGSYRNCKQVSAIHHLVEKRIIEALGEWLSGYQVVPEPAQVDPSVKTVKEKALKDFEDGLLRLEKQRGNLHDLLEQGVYDTDTFLARSREINERFKTINEDYDALSKEVQLDEDREKSRASVVPKVTHILAVYHELSDAQSKNELLKEVIEKVVYMRESGGRWSAASDNFELSIYPKLPKFII